MRSGRTPPKARSRIPGALVAAALSLLVLGVACSSDDEAVPGAVAAGGSQDAAVERVVDGDTVTLAGGTVVRLVQIDAPEVRGSECYADEATALLSSLLPPGTAVRIETDAGLDQRDRYGRTLAYVFKGDENVNATLVESGAASVWFYDGDRGRYADDLLRLAQEAQAESRGLWGACDATLDPFAAVATSAWGSQTAVPAATAVAAPSVARVGERGCHPSYDPCLPVVDDLNCSAVEALGQAPVRVAASDPYRLDGDGDGTGCQ